jgi:hypothetical protein
MPMPLVRTLLAGSLFWATMFAGCTAHVGYRAYDPAYSDYHVWGPSEGVYYNQWVVETHRPHRDYRRLNRRDQGEYWKWRHGHPDRH